MTGNCANKFQNKNLWGGITYKYVHNNVSYEQYPDGSIKVNGTNDTQDTSYSLLSGNSEGRTKTLPAGTYTLSGGSANVILELCNSGGTTLDRTTTTKFTKTITLGAETTIFVRARVNTGVSVNNEIIYIQLEQGSTATDYIPHAEQNAPLSLGNIEAYEGDEIQIDYVQKAGYKKVTGARFVKNMGKMIVDNNTVFNKNDADDSNFLYYITKSDRLAGTEVLSNCLSNKTLGTLNGDNSIENVGIATISNGKLIYFNVGHYVDSNNATAVRDFLISKNAIICYKLETPITTEITDQTLLAQLETLINMKTYKEVTNIDLTGEDLAPVLDCDYYKSISSLEDRIEILEAQVALLEE